jgi:hypothetical protein
MPFYLNEQQDLYLVTQIAVRKDYTNIAMYYAKLE